MFGGLRLLSQLDSHLRSNNFIKQRIALLLWPNTFSATLSSATMSDATIFATSSLLKLSDFFKQGENPLRSLIVDCISSMFSLIKNTQFPITIFKDTIEDVFKRILSVHSSNDPVAKGLCYLFFKEIGELISEDPLLQYILIWEKIKMMFEWDSLFDLAYCVSWYATSSFSNRLFEACLLILERVDEYNLPVRKLAFELSSNNNLSLDNELKQIQRDIPNLFKIV